MTMTDLETCIPIQSETGLFCIKNTILNLFDKSKISTYNHLYAHLQPQRIPQITVNHLCYPLIYLPSLSCLTFFLK